MDKTYLKKILTGIGIAGLVTGLGAVAFSASG
jgi:radical SAM modification target selenobiotic family peptide